MRIIQLSDTHISREHPSRKGDLERCIASINSAEPRPDIVVHTGDVAHDGLAEEYEIARGLLETLCVPCFVLPGNRDNRQELIKAFADSRHIRPQMEFVQYSIEQFRTRLIFIDTLSQSSNKGRLCQVRLAHVESMLSADTARPAILFMHHPPFEVAEIPDPFQFESWSEVEALAALIGRHPQIRSVHCGHVHRTVHSAIGPVEAGTVSCVAVDLRKGTAIPSSDARPVFEIHDVP